MSFVPRLMRRAGSAIDRGVSAEAHGLGVNGPFLSQLLENPVEAAAIRLIAEGRAHIAARKVVGQARQRCADVHGDLNAGEARGRKAIE
jgi:hypothetical protein